MCVCVHLYVCVHMCMYVHMHVYDPRTLACSEYVDVCARVHADMCVHAYKYIYPTHTCLRCVNFVNRRWCLYECDHVQEYVHECSVYQQAQKTKGKACCVHVCVCVCD